MKIPSGGGHLSGDGATDQGDDKVDGEAMELLRDYEMVQYHYLFGGEERMEEYFRLKE